MQPPQKRQSAVAKIGPTLIVLGFDDQQKAWAARFIDVKPDLWPHDGSKGADKVEFKA
jgi:hypothetical protein